jgi:membrane-associated phospholipid phosphatase
MRSATSMSRAALRSGLLLLPLLLSGRDAAAEDSAGATRATSSVALQLDALRPVARRAPSTLSLLDDQLSPLSRAGWTPLAPEEYGVTLGGALATAGLILLVPEPPSGWKRDLPLDRPFFELLGGHSRAARQRLSDVSDVMQGALLAFPLGVDVGVVSLLLEQRPELAWQLAWMDLEAFAASTALMVLTKRVVGRVRPLIPPCEGDPSSHACGSDASRRSFVSGHATASFTAAGLVCAHHVHLGLFGGGLADDLTCAAAVGLATATAALRVASEQHYFTDVAAGAVLGLASGWLLPWLLHGPEDPRRAGAALDGSGRLELAIFGGLLRAGDEARPAGALEASVRHRITLDDGLAGPPTALGALLRGLIVSTSSPREPALAARALTASARLELGPVGVGGVVDYQSLLADGRATVQVAGGPEVTLTLMEHLQPILLTGRWLPLFEGARGLWAVEVELPLARHVSARIAAQPLLAAGPDGARGALALFGLGGRLPW